MRFFVSYTTRDNYLNLTRLSDVYSVISQFGDTYVDLLHNASKDQQKRVENELAISSIVIFLKTPAVSESFWFLKEKKLAVQLQKKCIEISIDNKRDWVDTLKHIEFSIENEFSANNGAQWTW